MIPSWLNKHLNEEDLNEIRQKVKNWEVNTNAEIVPMIVRSSVPDYLKPLLLIVALVFSALASGGILFFLDSFLVMPDLMFFAAFVGTTLAIFAFLFHQIIQGKFPILGTKSTQLALVENRALLEFYSHKFHETLDNTGILLFVSIAERRAVVLADKKISDKHDPETWGGVVQHLIDGAKNKMMGKGFINAIDACGKILVQDFPAKKENPNEIPDHLVIKE